MEKVQLNLERLLPELRDLERKKVFTKTEIGDIVAKRRAHELSCAKRDVKPVDYLRYIEYETRLEKLRKTRASRLKVTTKKTLSDHSIAAHITQLHRLATRRFPSSLLIWDASLAHALAGSSPVLVSRTLTDAIAMHPTHVTYWLMASRWESDGDGKGMGGGNEEAARRLCMRALRFLRGTEGEKEIWKEWIRVEVLFAERMRERWALLGIGKLPEKGKVEKTDESAGAEVDGEDDESVAIEAPAEPEDDEVDRAAQQVAAAASGQEALREGVVVRVVIDNCLKSFNYSISSYELLLRTLRALPSILRLPLLDHVYTSLASQITSTSPSYASAIKILACRPLYDVPFDPATKGTPGSEEIKVSGEALVDAVGAVADEFWKTCKGRKGKGKQEKGSVEVWEAFCGWLEEAEEQIDDEDLSLYLSTNLTSALSMAPPSPRLALMQLRHLQRTEASSDSILSHASKTTSRFGSAPTPDSIREDVWVARVEATLALSPSSSSAFDEALASLPFSGKLWDLYASWAEDTLSQLDTAEWYSTSLARVQRLDCVPPVAFESSTPPPRDLIPQRFLDFLSSDSASLSLYLPTLLATPLSPAFISRLLALPSLSSESRKALHERAVGYPSSGIDEWLAYGRDLLVAGDVQGANEVIRRAGRALGSKEAVGMAWMKVLDGLDAADDEGNEEIEVDTL